MCGWTVLVPGCQSSVTGWKSLSSVISPPYIVLLPLSSPFVLSFYALNFFGLLQLGIYNVMFSTKRFVKVIFFFSIYDWWFWLDLFFWMLAYSCSDAHTWIKTTGTCDGTYTHWSVGLWVAKSIWREREKMCLQCQFIFQLDQTLLIGTVLWLSDHPLFPGTVFMLVAERCVW